MHGPILPIDRAPSTQPQSKLLPSLQFDMLIYSDSLRRLPNSKPHDNRDKSCHLPIPGNEGVLASVSLALVRFMVQILGENA